MFTAIFLTLIGFLIIIILRDGIHNNFFLRSHKKKILRKAAHYLAVKQWQEADFQLSLIEAPHDREYLLSKCQVLRGTNKYAEALSFINEILVVHPNDLLLLAEKGRILNELGHHQEAFSLLFHSRAILRSESDLIYYARSAIGAKEYDKAWDILSTQLDHCDNGHIHGLAGIFFYEQKKYEEALPYFSLALKKDEDNVTLLFYLAHCYRALGHLEDAEKLFTHLLKEDPGHVEATLGLGSCYEERGHFLKALLLLQNGKAWEKRDPTLLFQAGLLAMRCGKYQCAHQYFEYLLETRGECTKLLSYYGYCQERMKNWEKAEEIYLYLLTNYPDHFDAYLSLAWLYGVGLSKKLSSDKALSLAYHAAHINPTSLTWEIVSACEARAGNFDKAHFIQEYLVSRETKPQNRNRHFAAMRHLRKHLPLEDHHLQKNLVA